MPTSYPILPDRSAVTALLGVDGSTLASFINPAVVVEGGFTQFARGTFHGLTVQATNPAAIAGTAGMKVFGNTATTGHTNMGFIARRVMVRNNGATPVHLGWVAGESTTGGLIAKLEKDGSNILVHTKVAHGLAAGTTTIYLEATGAALSEDGVKLNGVCTATYVDADSFTVGTTSALTTVTADHGFFYKGFDSYVQPGVYTAGAVTLGGLYCEASSIPNDWFVLPYNIAALFVLNPAGGATVTNTAFKADVIFLR
jgi:hypothetical protein